MTRLFWIAIAGAGMTLGACSPGGGQKAIDPETAVFQAKTAYVAALSIAVTYNGLPRCGKPTSPPICSDTAIVLQLRKADGVAALTLDAAEATVRTPGVKSSIAIAAASTATQAVKVLQAVITEYGIK